MLNIKDVLRDKDIVYRKGDIVKIKTEDELKNEFGNMVDDEYYLCGYSKPDKKSNRKVANYFTKDMLDFCGLYGVITAIEDDYKIHLSDASDFIGVDQSYITKGWNYLFTKEMIKHDESYKK